MFERISKLVKGFLALFISGIEQANPKALLEGEIQSFNEAVGNFNKNLARQAGMVEQLREKLKKQKKEQESLKARATALYTGGQTEEAGRLALQLKQITSDIADNENGLKQADDMYRNLSRQRDVYVKDAQRRIEAIKQKMSRVEMAEAQAKLAEISSSTAFDMSGSGATLQRLEESLDERVATATGKARVASDMTKTGEWTVKEDEMKAMENQALAEFATSMGLAAPPVATAPAKAAAVPEALRDLGPTEKTGA